MELQPLPPNYVGPTWQKLQDGSWHLPKHTLGWGVIDWWYEYVRSPGGENAGEPFEPTLEQARWVLWWYAIDEGGRFVYRSGVLRRMKGWGKDPLAAAMALAEVAGPVRFSHWDENGNPVGKECANAWIQVAAVSQDQTKNTFSLFPVMVSKTMKTVYSMEINKQLIYACDGARRIEAVTSSPHSMEGNRPTFVIQNETQWWVEMNEGHKMAGVISGNITKIPAARKLSICNAHIPGEESVAETDYDAWMKVEGGQAIDMKMMYDALEAPANTPVGEIPPKRDNPEEHELGLIALREGLEIARGDSYWLPLDAILEEVLDIRQPVTESRRKFLNQVNAAEDSWIAPHQWDAVALTDEMFSLKPGDKVTLGFDGSKTNDWTALVACRVDDAMLFPIRIWNPDKFHNHEVPRDQVDAMVHSAFERYNVVAFRADVKEFEAYVDQWAQKWYKQLKVKASPANAVAFDMRGNQKRFALDCERFEDAVFEREVYHNGDPVLRQHVLNAKRHPTNYDAIAIRKASKDSSRKIDAAVSSVLAFGARHDYLVSKYNRSGKVTVIR